MTCQCDNVIKIFRGDDTNWNGENLLNFVVTSASTEIDLSTMTAKFIVGSIVFDNIFLETGEFTINFTHQQTSTMPWGLNKGVLQILDADKRIKTVTNSINLFVTSEPFEEQSQTIDVTVPEGSPVTIELKVGSGGGSWGSITGDIQNQEDLQAEFATKQDIISDLSTIRSGASAGATAVQPATLETALATKQNALNATQLEAVNSGANSANIAQISTNTNRISSIEAKIPAQASSENQLADKDFVNSSIATSTANFIGTFESISALESYSGTVTNNDYAFVINRVVTDNGNDWANITDLNAYDKTLLTNFDYAWVINGSKFDLYRFDIVMQAWDLRAENIQKTDVSLNTAYNRYKATVGNTVTWAYEYTLNNSSFTASQWAAINSGATAENIAQIAANTTAISGKQDIIGDLATIRSGAALGATSVQPADLANYATTSDLATRAHQADGVTIIDSGSAISTVAVREQNADLAVKQWVGTKVEYDLIATKDEDTLYIVTDDNQGGGGGTDLESIDGYDPNVPVQRLANLSGNFKWQTKSVVYDNFNQYNYLTPKITWPDTVSTVDFILEVVAFIPDTSDHSQNIIIFGDTSNPHALFYGSYQHNPRGGFGYWDGSSNIWYVDAITQTPATKWIRLTGTNGNMSVYCIDDNNYTLETLPELATWTYQGVCPETLGNSSYIQFNFAASTGYFHGTLKNWQIKANDSVVFDLRNDNSVELSNSNTKDYMGIKITEHWN